ncbi:MAG: hypothetical protein IPH31_23395, partial [Lewinellaceae bacterium]|nr:hypothetical protein [Lewinellaceae bacterium]
MLILVGEFGSGVNTPQNSTNLDNPSDSLAAIYTFSTPRDRRSYIQRQTFPQPYTVFFTLERLDIASVMRIFSNGCRDMARFDVSPDNTYSIGHLPLAASSFSFEDKNGRLFQAVRLTSDSSTVCSRQWR